MVLQEAPHHNVYEDTPHLWLTIAPKQVTTIRRTIMGSQTTSLLPPGTVNLSYNHGALGVTLDNPVEAMHVCLRARIVSEVGAVLFRGDPEKIALVPALGDDDPVTLAIFENIRQALSLPSSRGQLFSDDLARALVAHLLTRHATRQDLALPRTVAGQFSKAKADNVISHIRENVASDIGIEEPTGAVHCSASHFARTFKATFNCSPHQFLMQARIDPARELLSSSILPVGQVAAACGFPNHAHFSVVFRRLMGMTPA